MRTVTPCAQSPPLQFVRNCLDQIPTFAQRSALNPCVRCPVENAVRTINYFKNKVLTWSICVLTILRWYSIKWLSLVKNSSFYNVFLSSPLYFYLKFFSCKVYALTNVTQQFRIESMCINFYMYMYLVSSIRTECILLECKEHSNFLSGIIAVLFCRRRSSI